jgi:hypothetical protein
VFDPTQSGHAIVQIEHEEQSISNATAFSPATLALSSMLRVCGLALKSWPTDSVRSSTRTTRCSTHSSPMAAAWRR